MGNKTSRGKQSVDICISHPKFVQSVILYQPDQDFLFTSVTCEQKTLKKWQEAFEIASIDQSFLMTPKKHSFKSAGICGRTGTLELWYDNYPYLLTEEIYNRKGKKIPFTQPQLWYLLYAFLSAKNHLRNLPNYPDGLIGDIRPQNVFINAEGNVKFSHLLSWPGEKINYGKTFEGYATYLAPEDFQLLSLGVMENSQNNKSQLFSIGFTLVGLGILKDNIDCYDVEEQKWNRHQAKKRINAFKCSSFYSQLLRAIISALCQFEPKKRINYDDIWEWISQYQEQIANRQPFMIDELPSKINQYINLFRTEVAQLNPESTLNTIRSLRQSQQSRGNAVSYKSNTKISNFSINNPTTQVTQFRSPQNKDFKIHLLRSPAKVPNFETRRIEKSPEGYYAAKNVNNKVKPFRVFIQYKSPQKPIQKPFAETVYIEKKKQAEFDKRSQKSNKSKNSKRSKQSSGSQRNNRFIEQVKNQELQKIQINKQESIKNEYKKESPIYKVSEEQQNQQQEKITGVNDINCVNGVDGSNGVNGGKCINGVNGVAEVVSEQVIVEKKTIDHEEPKIQQYFSAVSYQARNSPRKNTEQKLKSSYQSLQELSWGQKKSSLKKSQYHKRHTEEEERVINANMKVILNHLEDRQGQQKLETGQNHNQQVSNRGKELKEHLEDRCQQDEQGRILFHHQTVTQQRQQRTLEFETLENQLNHKKHPENEKEKQNEGDQGYSEQMQVPTTGGPIPSYNCQNHHHPVVTPQMQKNLYDPQTYDAGCRVPPVQLQGGKTEEKEIKDPKQLSQQLIKQVVPIAFDVPSNQQKPQFSEKQLSQMKSGQTDPQHYMTLIQQITPVTIQVEKQQQLPSFCQEEEQKVTRELAQKMAQWIENQAVQNVRNIQSCSPSLQATLTNGEIQLQNNIQKYPQEYNVQRIGQINQKQEQVQIRLNQSHHSACLSQQEIIQKELSVDPEPQNLSGSQSHHESLHSKQPSQKNINTSHSHDQILIQQGEDPQETNTQLKNQQPTKQQYFSGYSMHLVPLGPEVHGNSVVRVTLDDVEQGTQNIDHNGQEVDPIGHNEQVEQKQQENQDNQNREQQKVQQGYQQETSELSVPQNYPKHESSSIQLPENEQGIRITIKQQNQIENGDDLLEKECSSDIEGSGRIHSRYVDEGEPEQVNALQQKFQFTAVLKGFQKQQRQQQEYQESGEHQNKNFDTAVEDKKEKKQQYQSQQGQKQQKLEEQNQKNSEKRKEEIDENLLQEQPSKQHEYSKFSQKQVEALVQQANTSTHIKHDSTNNMSEDLAAGDPFLKDVKQTNEKYNEIRQNQQQHQQIALQLVQHRPVGTQEILSHEGQILTSSEKPKPEETYQQPLLEAQNVTQTDNNVTETFKLAPSQQNMHPSQQYVQRQKPQKQVMNINSQKVTSDFLEKLMISQKNPTQSEFGNISQIMDINIQFNNTLNAEDRAKQFLACSEDPKGQDFLKELLYLSQQGKVRKEDLDKIHINQEDKEKLSNLFDKIYGKESNNGQKQPEIIVSSSEQRNNIQNKGATSNKLEPSQEQFQHLGEENKNHSHYDQSNVDIMCSEMKTQEVILVNQKKTHNQMGHSQGSPQSKDIIQEVKQMNNSLSQYKSQQEETTKKLTTPQNQLSGSLNMNIDESEQKAQIFKERAVEVHKQNLPDFGPLSSHNLEGSKQQQQGNLLKGEEKSKSQQNPQQVAQGKISPNDQTHQLHLNLTEQKPQEVEETYQTNLVQNVTQEVQMVANTIQVTFQQQSHSGNLQPKPQLTPRSQKSSQKRFRRTASPDLIDQIFGGRTSLSRKSQQTEPVKVQMIELAPENRIRVNSNGTQGRGWDIVDQAQKVNRELKAMKEKQKSPRNQKEEQQNSRN